MIQEDEVRKSKLAAEAEKKKIGSPGTEIGCQSRGTEIKRGGRSRRKEIGCRDGGTEIKIGGRSRGKVIGCQSRGTDIRLPRQRNGKRRENTSWKWKSCD